MTEAEKVSNLPPFARQAEELLLGGAASQRAGKEKEIELATGDERSLVSLREHSAAEESPHATSGSHRLVRSNGRETLGDRTEEGIVVVGGDLHGRAREAFVVVAEGLSRVEAKMSSGFASEASQLTEVSSYLLGLGGKRIRPVLALLMGRLIRDSDAPENLIDAAAGIELIHMATLLHDDIIDQSSKRRHQPSALAKYGFVPTLLAGDFLWVRAFGLCAHLGEFIVRATERACVELTEGELLEGKLDGDSTYPIDRYLNVIGRKTASLFWLSCAVGAHAAGGDPTVVEEATAFGYEAGLAFQIIDDILDVVADEDLLGKPSGTDLRQRTPSLVNILWLEQDPKRARAFFQATPSVQSVTEAIHELKGSEVLDRCRRIAESHTARAQSALSRIVAHVESGRAGSGGDSQNRIQAALEALLHFTLERCY